ncbi:hypothetical protein BBD42_01980 [Paenibacillus sp. BIHB 4019]|uniref:Uncharacterized protein n=1 Tax=Paenibacillus sp. BIHB 4019 TaxID=1870819 RepID=A0A1B2DCD0_9BACL|nr:hypothetical protein [Paenibacillus sp. BIHB 4019]ANY65374.1 hypothetical protein BBD42_01980 [Paenibacillus sp. BIHB 4019]
MKIFKKIYYKLANPILNQIASNLQQHMTSIQHQMTSLEQSHATSTNKLVALEEKLNTLQQIGQSNEDRRHIEKTNILKLILDSLPQQNIPRISQSALNNSFSHQIESTSKKTEYEVFSYVSIDQLISAFNQGTNIAVISHWPKLYNDLSPNIKLINPMSLENLLSLYVADSNNIYFISSYPSALPQLAQNSDVVFVGSPVLSKYLLNSGAIKDFAEAVTEKLVLSVFASTTPILVSWEYGFSSVEIGDTYYRWIESTSKEACINIHNITDETYSFQLEWTSHSLSHFGTEFFTINGCGLNKTYNLNEQFVFSEKITVVPGDNKLIFNYLGETIVPENGSRNLSFCIMDMKLNGIDSKHNLFGEKVYNSSQNITQHLVNDSKVREILHTNGFFEVSSTLFYNNGHYSTLGPTSRYFHATNSYYYLEGNEQILNDAYEAGLSTLLVVYTAERRVMKGLEND